MTWNVPYSQRQFKRSPGVHTFSWVTWVVVGLDLFILGVLMGGSGYIFIPLIH